MKKILLLLMVFLTIISCSTYVYRITPYEEDLEIDYLDGKEQVVKSNKYFEVKMNFKEITSGYITFNMSIKNKWNQKILVDPDKFYYEHGPFEKDKNITNKVSVINPDKKIKQYKKQIKSEKNSMTASAAVGLIDAIASVSTNSEYDDDHYQNERYEHERNIDRLEKKIEYWKKYPLRKSTVMPDSEISGEINFPEISGGGILEIYIPINDEIVKFIYKAELEKI